MHGLAFYPLDSQGNFLHAKRGEASIRHLIASEFDSNDETDCLVTTVWSGSSSYQFFQNLAQERWDVNAFRHKYLRSKCALFESFI